jgi:beta-phosphoglucomutase
MDWIQKFDLFLFDFDGLLVNTEDLHYAAYLEMCRRRGFDLKWTLSEFFQAAHLSATGIQEGIYRLFPNLLAPWDVLYAEKKKIYQELLEKGEFALLPGVEEVLKAVEGKRRCVVTNSTKAQTDLVKEKIPILQSIPHWFTRESYAEPKPAPECYLNAIEQLGQPKDRMIGFEDSVRGLKALRGAGVSVTLLICPQDHPQLKQPALLEGFYFPSFEAIPSGFNS